ncbi:MAG: tetratricopeptide repeat protein [Rhodospirillales bacterium]|nr:tetratricopeptide repeat protein [Rhodospirillales bacterium]
MNRRERRRQAKQQNKKPGRASGNPQGNPQAGIHYRQGLERDRAGDVAGAVEAFGEAVAIEPGYADAWMEMGLVFNRLNRLDDALEALRRAVMADPHSALAFYNFGCVLERAGHADKALDVFAEAARLKANFVEAHHAQAGARKRLNDFDGAVKDYRAAIDAAGAVGRDFAPAHAALANTLRELGHTDEAHEEFARAIALDPGNAGLRVKAALVLPVIPESAEAIDAARAAFADNVAALRAEGIRLTDPYTEAGVTNFYLAYHDRDDRPLQVAVAAMFLDACPGLAWTAPHCEGTLKEKKRLKIGVCSAYMRGHTLGKLTLGLLKTLSRNRFEVVLFRLVGSGAEDEVSAAIDAASDQVVRVPMELEAARNMIAAEAPDILFYPDIGMDPFTYFLAFARLAPVQVTSWGHPDTTGIPNLDYFLSCRGIETEGSSDQYSETLACLKDPPTYYYKPDAPSRTFTRADFGLPEQGALYLCPQTLFKIHPEFDGVLGEILERDPAGHLVLIDDPFGGHWRDLLMRRFEKSFPESAGRVRFVAKMPLQDFFGLLLCADAVLDLPTFSGGNSSIEAFSLGAPIVAWPGRFARGRVTAAYYRQMGVEDLIASGREEYVDLALRLAGDESHRNEMKARILENSQKLFENTAMIRELEGFLIKAYESRRKGNKPVRWP